MLLTAHQAFFTNEALTQIALTTFRNVSDLITKKDIENKVALLIKSKGNSIEFPFLLIFCM
jgi:D-lactate dehydrogenase